MGDGNIVTVNRLGSERTECDKYKQRESEYPQREHERCNLDDLSHGKLFKG
jgi:hypothetical protein